MFSEFKLFLFNILSFRFSSIIVFDFLHVKFLKLQILLYRRYRQNDSKIEIHNYTIHEQSVHRINFVIQIKRTN